MMALVRIGVALPQYAIDLGPGGRGRGVVPALLEQAKLAEALGLDSVWLSDHPFAVGPDGVASGAAEPMVSAAAILRATTRVRVGTLVLAATMRAPGLVGHIARTLVTADSGRFVLGLGGGWYAPEHAAFGLPLPPYRARVGSLEATVTAVRSHAAGAHVLVGGSGSTVLGVAARHADEWNVAWDLPPRRFAALSARLDEECDRAGRDPRSVDRSVGVTVLVGRDANEIETAVARLRERAAFLRSVDAAALGERIVAGTPEQCAERLAAYGSDGIVVALLLRDDPEMLELFATEVAPLLR
jgi:alkanesulfonate monooxygenase SsuD/methylene tetrahydromethanopterin reductase-like flavin-dependent oxidoreductase (luciferase family)